MSYKDTHPYNVRLDEFNKINYKYPEKIPVICETKPDDMFLPKLSQVKYLVDNSLTVGQFMYVVRKRLKVPSDKAIFLFVGNNAIPPTGAPLSQVYNEHKDKCGFLYFICASESVFGA
jgi:GABA(A) receptor-associated protein